MSEATKIDPFKPQQPSIPGVVSRPESPQPEEPSAPQPPAAAARPQAPQPQIKLIAIAGAGVLIMLLGLIVWGRSASHKTIPAPAASASATPTAATADATKPQPAEPMGPGPIATVAELSKPWAAKRFQYRNYVTGQYEPAMVVHLPHGEYWGFSLIEPFGNCQLEFVTDLAKLKSEYGYRADHPMVGDPCNHTVYDLERYGGGASTDDLVRGVIVQGNGIRPPMAIEIKVQGNDIVAGRSE
jgi:hypothetical protein